MRKRDSLGVKYVTITTTTTVMRRCWDILQISNVGYVQANERAKSDAVRTRDKIHSWVSKQ
jgi:hypothetical protein